MQSTWISFLLITVCLGGAAAWMTGRAIAQSWQSIWKAVAYALPLALAVRFFHYALAHEELLAPVDLAVEFAVMVALGVLSHRVAATDLTVRQYPWLYRRTSPVTLTPVTLAEVEKA